MVVSLLVYALLLQMIIGTPLQLFNLFRHSYVHWITPSMPAWQAWLFSSMHLFPTDFFQLKVWYWLPELQIPFELLLGHITFLSVLDQKKDLVGRMQHRWMVWLSGRLGMTRFIIPVPMLKRRRRRSGGGAGGVAGEATEESGQRRRQHRTGGGGTTAMLRRARRLQRQQQQQPQRTEAAAETPVAAAASVASAAVAALPPPPPSTTLPSTGDQNSHTEAGGAAATAAAELAVEEVIEVGPPLVRPPPGWDVRGHGARWAWINETPSAIERNVAPRVIPSHWLLRTCLLVGISWCLSIVIALFLMVVPLQIGRSLSQLIYVPVAWQHDPLHFIVGLFVVKHGLDMIDHTATWVTMWEKLPMLWPQVPSTIWRRMGWLLTKRMISYWIVGVVLYLLAYPASSLTRMQTSWMAMITTAVPNANASMDMEDHDETSERWWFMIRQSLRWMAAGWMILDIGLLVVLRTGLVRIIGRYLGGTALATWLLHCQVALERVSQDVSPLWERNAFPSWTAIDDVLTLLDTTIVSATLWHVIVDAALLMGVFVTAMVVPEMKSVGGSLASSWSSTVTMWWFPSMSMITSKTWISWVWFGLWLSSLVVRWCGSLLHDGYVKMYGTLRDQHYLIGRRLKNAVREVREARRWLLEVVVNDDRDSRGTVCGVRCDVGVCVL